MRFACAGRARRPWIPTPSGTTAPAAMRGTPPASAPVRGRAAASSSSVGRPGISTVACPCRSVRSSSSHARIPGISSLCWMAFSHHPAHHREHIIFHAGKRHADTPTRTRPDLDHKHHKSSYRPKAPSSGSVRAEGRGFDPHQARRHGLRRPIGNQKPYAYRDLYGAGAGAGVCGDAGVASVPMPVPMAVYRALDARRLIPLGRLLSDRPVGYDGRHSPR